MTQEINADSGEPKSRRREVLLVGAIVAGALALRAWALCIRGVLDYDETYYYILGRNLLTGRGYTLNGLPHTAFGPLYPVLVGLASLFTSSVRLATCSVSAIAGALLPLPVYFLARDIQGRRTAAVSAAVSAVWPALFFFAARSVRYADRLYAGSEPLFVTLVATAFLYFWLTARRGGWRNAALAGFFCGLAALVRDEAVVIFAFLCAWLIADAVFSRKRQLSAAAHAPLAAVVFLVALAPFLIHVRAVGGRWGLGSKLPNFTQTRAVLWEWVEGDRGERYLAAHYALNADGTRMESAYWGISDWHRSRRARQSVFSAGVSLVRNPDWRWLMVFGRVFVKGALPLVPRYGWPLILLGLLRWCRDRGHLRLLALLAFLVVAQIWMGVSIYVLARFELPLLVILALILGDGVDLAGGLLGRLGALAPKLREPLTCAAYAAPVAAVLLLMCRSGILANLAGSRAGGAAGAVSSTAFDMRVADEVKGILPADSVLMCNKPWIAVRAGMDWRVSPADTPGRILEYVSSAGIEYGLLGPWQVPEPLPGTPLHPYYRRTFTDGDRLFLFDFTVSPAAAAAVPGEVDFDGREEPESDANP